MAHDHSHRSSTRSRLLIVIGIVSVVLIAEVVGAALSGSLALLADAGHMLSDLTGLVVALVAAIVASRPASERQTYGYQRAEVFGALINALILIVVALFVGIEAVRRLIEPGPAEVQGSLMLIVAGIGLVANVVAYLVLRRGDTTSLNMRGATLEVLGDLLGSIAVIVAGIVIVTTGFAAADAIASLLIAIMIVPRAVSLLRDVVRVLSQSVPVDTSVAEIREHILGTDGVVDVHDVHVWAITSGEYVFSAHVVVEPQALVGERSGCLLDELSDCLAHHFDVEHSTFQLEPAEHAAHEQPHHA
ncbi:MULTISPECIES: cation diffusion facilitator family transporter [unclassified Leifsonia]|uniref:cation diffusion facilitator family transporter n=1 Tax=unclassified Leifsonia TaxID=2663824 RepID=UPI0006F1C80F|nr:MULTISPECIES: cation diffusion facilitator family transporter [unclassified Leifsonia]KQX07347.1 cation transporter [Leifsonia sp. Root1293]KRA11629.1 cation transporter [Leifsonia sp. Root60]